MNRASSTPSGQAAPARGGRAQGFLRRATCLVAGLLFAPITLAADFGEVCKSSVIGVRVYGVPEADQQALQACFERIDDDCRRRARDTEYHNGKLKDDHLHLNCAKTIGTGSRFGAWDRDLQVWGAPILHLPNRFPSVHSRDLRSEQGRHEDFDRLYARHLLHGLTTYGVRVDDARRWLEIDLHKSPMADVEAAVLATRDALADRASRLGGMPVSPRAALEWHTREDRIAAMAAKSTPGNVPARLPRPAATP